MSDEKSDIDKCIEKIRSLIDYDSCQQWGRALRYAVSALEELKEEK